MGCSLQSVPFSLKEGRFLDARSVRKRDELLGRDALRDLLVKVSVVEKVSTLEHSKHQKKLS